LVAGDDTSLFGDTQNRRSKGESNCRKLILQQESAQLNSLHYKPLARMCRVRNVAAAKDLNKL
jgi:hypothetical protein